MGAWIRQYSPVKMHVTRNTTSARRSELRPLATGEILSWGLSCYARGWVRFAAAFLLFFFFPAAALAVPLYMSLVAGTARPIEGVSGTIQYTALMAGVSAGVALAIAGPAVLLIAAREYLGEDLTLFSALRRLLRRFPALAVCAAISAAAILLQLQLCTVLLGAMIGSSDSEGAVLGIALLLMLVASLFSWLAVRYALAMPVIVLEECGVFRAFGRSASLFRSAGGQVYAVLVGGAVAMLLLSLPAFALIASVDRAMAEAEARELYVHLLRLTWFACALPLQFALAAPLYYSLRCRQDGFDLVAMALALDVEMPREKLSAFLERGYLPEDHSGDAVTGLRADGAAAARVRP